MRSIESLLYIEAQPFTQCTCAELTIIYHGLVLHFLCVSIARLAVIDCWTWCGREKVIEGVMQYRTTYVKTNIQDVKHS